MTRMSPSRCSSSARMRARSASAKPMASSVRSPALAVEHADDDLLAVRRGQRRDAEVDDRCRCTATRARPSCGRSAVGDVEAGEDLDARDERRRDAARQRARVAQHAVDAMAHGDPLLLRLDVDVARARLDAFGEQLVDQPDDRRTDVDVARRSTPRPRSRGARTSTGGATGSRRAEPSGYQRAICLRELRGGRHAPSAPDDRWRSRRCVRRRDRSGSLVATISVPRSEAIGQDAVPPRPALGEERDGVGIDAG